MTGHRSAREMIDLGDGRYVQGFVEDGFGRLMDVVVDNFERRGDVGSACTVLVSGRVVCDLWGGYADLGTRRPWDRNTTAVMFSCSKGVLAICAYLLVQEELLNLDEPVARYWPEFGQAGKEAITVRQAMSHRAGLPSLDRDLSRQDVIAWAPVIAAIERQRPLFRPGDGHVYHAMTYGWVVGEVIRRITGQMPGRFFRAAIGDRLGLDIWIGVPNEQRRNVAHMEPPLPDENSALAQEAARAFDEDPLIERSMTMGGAFAFPAEDGRVTFNDPDLQAAEIPAANAVGSARSLATLYSACVTEVDGATLITPAAIADALVVQAEGKQLTRLPDDGARWGTGFQLSSPPFTPMAGPTSFGHAGAGGQLAFADATCRVAFAYLSNQMGGYGDARARELTSALRSVVGS